MRRSNFHLVHGSVAVCVLIALMSVGCGDNTMKVSVDNAMEVSVSGSVTRGGQPIREGKILFEPETSGPVADEPITNGNYQVRVPEGRYKITVTDSEVPTRMEAMKAPSRRRKVVEIREISSETRQFNFEL